MRPALSRWDIVFTSFSKNGRYRVTGINEDGRVTISIVETSTGQPVKMPTVANGGVRGVVISRSGSSPSEGRRHAIRYLSKLSPDT